LLVDSADDSVPQLELHPLLFLRSMSYVGHYKKEGLSFATPSICLYGELFNLPPHLSELLLPDDVAVMRLRVWCFRDAPSQVNIISHGFVFENEPKAKVNRNVEMGAFSAVGVSQKTLSCGRLLPKVRVSVHKSRGMMACSPNNAILAVDPVDTTNEDLRRFWVLIRDGNRTEITLNVLYVEEEEIAALQSALSAVSKIGKQTKLKHLCEELLQHGQYFGPLLRLMNTHLLK